MRPTVWWMNINRRLPSFKQVSKNSRQLPPRLVASLFILSPSHGGGQVSTHLKRIEAVEKDLKVMSETTVAKVELTNLRAEAKKLYDGLHIGLRSRLLRTVPTSLTLRVEFLDLRSHVWGIRGYNLSLYHKSTADASGPRRTRFTDALKERAEFRSTSLIEILPGVLFRTPLRSGGLDPCIYFNRPRRRGVPVQSLSSGSSLPATFLSVQTFHSLIWRSDPSPSATLVH